MNTQRRPTSYVTLDLTLPDVQTSLAVTQGDTTRRIVATIQDGGRPFELPRKWTAMLTGTKPDGKFLYNSCVIDYSGRIVYDFAAGTEIATAIGDYAVTFEIYDEAGDKVSSPSLWLSVKPDKTRDHASHDQFTAAQEILGRLNKVEDGLDFLEGDQDSEYLAYEGASLIRVNKEAPNGYDALKVSSYTDYLHIVKFDSTLYEVATNELAGYWVEINGKRAYVGSNTVDSLTLYTDHTMKRPSAFLAYPDDLIYILGDDVTDDMVDVIGAAPEDEYLMYNGTSLIRLNRETPSGYDALKVSSAVDGLHIVKFDSTLYEVATNELAGYWVEINGKRAYVGSNTVDSLTLYTDHTMTRPRAFFVSAGTLIYILGDDVTNAMRGVISAAPAGFGLGTFAAILPNSDFNKIWQCGMYRFGNDGENRPPFSDWGYLTVMSPSDHNSESIQIAFQQTSANVCVMRTKSHGVWSEWEWVNPPMKVGVEYRTTERFLEQPVYTMIRKIGGFSGDGTCTFGESGYHDVVRVYATASYGGKRLKVDDSKIKTIQQSAGYVYVQVIMGDETCIECHVHMWYTK